MPNKQNSILAISRHYRQKRMLRLLKTMGLDSTSTILDVGGLPQTWIGTGFESRVTLLNLNFPRTKTEPFLYVTGNACDMRMFKDQSFDLVFSNSVIEHVGDFSKQKQMANEIYRVGKNYWIQTPNRHFPLEVHFLFPFFQYMPTPIRHFIAKTWPFSFSKIYNLDPIFEADHIWLLSASELQHLFPNGTLLKERFAGLIKSLIIYKT